MAEQPPSAPPPATSSGPFKLKLKLGGSGAAVSSPAVSSNANGNTSSNANASASTSTSTSAIASTSIPAPTTTPALRVAEDSSRATGTPVVRGEEGNEDVVMEDAYPQEGSLDAEGSQNAGEMSPDDKDEEYKDSSKKKPKQPKKKATSKPPSKSASATPAASNTPMDSLVASPSGTSAAPPLPISSIGSINLPNPQGTAPKRAPAKRKKKDPATATPGDSSTSTPAEPPVPGTGRAWRKGLKGYTRPEGTVSTSASAAAKRRSKAALARMSEDLLDHSVEPEDFVPTVTAPGGLATSKKWPAGLPGGNEQSRATAAMASAVNKAFPVGPPPKTGSGFLVALPLDRKTPRPRSWKKTKREIIGPSGVPFFVSVYTGEQESPFADWLAENPRPPPVDKKAATLGVPNADGDTPAPEGGQTPSEADVSMLNDPTSAANAAPLATGKGANKGKGRGMPGVKRKPAGTGARKPKAKPGVAAAVSVDASAAATPVAPASEQPSPAVVATPTPSVGGSEIPSEPQALTGQ